MPIFQRAAVLALASVLLVPGFAQARWFSAEAAIMGTVVKVELWHEDAGAAEAAMAAVMAEMRRIDRLMSPFKEDSELSTVNRQAAEQAVEISAELFDLIARAAQFSQLSGGAFDITFASVGRLYDYRRGIQPGEELIAQHLPAIDYRHLLLDREALTIRFARPGVRIDLGGIAKGHAVDNCIALLAARGITQALVSAGGDTRLLGEREGRPWMIGIRDPRNEGSSAVIVPLADAAISTSGDYERYFEQDGQRYHHIISPQTGKSVGEVRSVSVIGPDATTTDALSTTLFVLGPAEALRLIDSLPELEAIIIDAAGALHYSAGLAPPG